MFAVGGSSELRGRILSFVCVLEAFPYPRVDAIFALATSTTLVCFKPPLRIFPSLLVTCIAVSNLGLSLPRTYCCHMLPFSCLPRHNNPSIILSRLLSRPPSSQTHVRDICLATREVWRAQNRACFSKYRQFLRHANAVKFQSQLRRHFQTVSLT